MAKIILLLGVLFWATAGRCASPEPAGIGPMLIAVVSEHSPYEFAGIEFRQSAPLVATVLQRAEEFSEQPRVVVVVDENAPIGLMLSLLKSLNEKQVVVREFYVAPVGSYSSKSINSARWLKIDFRIETPTLEQEGVR